MTRNVLTVMGTRPEVIKMAPVIRQLAARRDCQMTVCWTGQHVEMVAPLLETFGIEPDFRLDVMRPDQSLAGLTARLFEGIDRVAAEASPQWIVAQGDTTTVVVASLVAFYRRIPFAHVEAGLRTGNREHPFPEEINRRIADLVADAYFAPTQSARRALLDEKCLDKQIYVTGNTVIDAVLDVAGRPYDWDRGPLAGVPSDRRLVLVTAHRRESFGAPLRDMCQAIGELARRFIEEGIHIVYPVHLNPNVQGPVKELLSGLRNVSLLPPLDYVALVHLMKRAELILTDSGGIQEEAPALGVPVLVMRQTTERPEGIEAGVARLVGTSPATIVEHATTLLSDPQARRAMAVRANPYGDGQAARRIASILVGGGVDVDAFCP